ncbi:hypothetical protein ACFQ14_13780 [Pseudahrensia aquimaris]|uniref:Transmembrane protein n=1 Tax=Pseudahrensia aquimaris TaxID=744461 RepID=A0ABW3FJQ2_9HYPH
MKWHHWLHIALWVAFTLFALTDYYVFGGENCVIFIPFGLVIVAVLLVTFFVNQVVLYFLAIACAAFAAFFFGRLLLRWIDDVDIHGFRLPVSLPSLPIHPAILVVATAFLLLLGDWMEINASTCGSWP